VAQALIFATPLTAYAEDRATAPIQSELSTSADRSAPAGTPESVVVVIRAKLAEPGLRKVAHADDLAALAAFYENRSSGPLWTTDVGLSAKGQQALFEIEKADDWGLDKDAFDLPPVEHLPAEPGDQAAAEIRLDLAILKYARFARGGRFEPAKLSRKAYQSPPVLDPNAVLAEIARAEAPDAYLRSLHPKHDQFLRLLEALLRTRKTAASEGKNQEQEIRRILINMERWRWMPEDLGYVHVLSNTPEFMLYVVKDGKIIHADKTQVGTINYATPVISDKMTAVVFNPEWIAPPTVLREDLLPLLRKKRYATLKKLGFSVSYRGKEVNPERIDGTRRIFSLTRSSKSRDLATKSARRNSF
jgi:murein L,D-transpeptidase YcbB/YkuD